MSLHFIGIRDFPVLHRQFSSPSAKPDSPTSTRDLAQDSKDVLVQRLNDLANRLMVEEALEDEDITALHIDVDRMERVMRKAAGFHPADSLGRSSSSPSTVREHEDDLFWGPLFLLSWKTSLEMSPKAFLLAQEAETLNEQLSKALKELQARREESNHIHGLLIMRAERAVHRITDLESRVEELDADFEASQSELSFLRIQLRALEVQGLQYIPFNADKELSESIKNWKLDWADIDQRTKTRRRKCKDLLRGLDDSQTAVDDPR